MDDLLDDLTRAARRCERAVKTFKEGRFAELRERIQEQVGAAHRAWSGSWIGYHARVYIENFNPPHADDHFDSEWGWEAGFNNTTRGRWVLVEDEAAKTELLSRARISAEDQTFLRETATRGRNIFTETRNELLPTLDAVLASKDDPVFKRVRDQIDKLTASVPEREIALMHAPKRFISRDSAAVSEGLKVPPHVQLEASILAQTSHGMQLDELATHARYLVTYLQKGMKMTGKSVAKTEGKIVIGHGQSPVWRDLKDFLVDRLKLNPDEYNRQSAAGLSTKERLETMLDEAVFAFLVMTAEDELADGTKIARANVVHEAGLFQGRLGFERAIILLEEGCEEFSNIVGLTQIRFPKGNVKAEFEEIRRVLERERILKS
jgi:hypothetical protein